jgi:hypothetical protein
MLSSGPILSAIYFSAADSFAGSLPPGDFHLGGARESEWSSDPEQTD